MPHANHKPAGELVGLVQTLVGMILTVLVIAGIGGSIWHLMSPGGWLARLLGQREAGGLAAAIAMLVLAFAYWMLREMIPVGLRNRYADWFVYVFAAAGALYAFRFLAGGAA